MRLCVISDKQFYQTIFNNIKTNHNKKYKLQFCFKIMKKKEKPKKILPLILFCTIFSLLPPFFAFPSSQYQKPLLTTKLNLGENFISVNNPVFQSYFFHKVTRKKKTPDSFLIQNSFVTTIYINNFKKLNLTKKTISLSI